MKNGKQGREVDLTAQEQTTLRLLTTGLQSAVDGATRQNLESKGLVDVLDSTTVILTDMGREWIASHPSSRH